MIVYLITNTVSGKIYVGKTLGSVQDRWKEHLKDSRRKSTRALCAAIRKYGHEAFELTVLASALRTESLNDLEILLIKQMQSQNPRIGYNQTSGGEGSNGFQGRTHSEETRKLISEKLRGRKGHKHVWSEDQRKRLSQAMQGNQNRNWTGRKHAEASRLKIGAGVRLFHAQKPSA